MKLCICSNQTLEEQEKLVRDLFIHVPNKKVIVPPLNEPIAPYSPERLGQVLR